MGSFSRIHRYVASCKGSLKWHKLDYPYRCRNKHMPGCHHAGIIESPLYVYSWPFFRKAKAMRPVAGKAVTAWSSWSSLCLCWLAPLALWMGSRGICMKQGLLCLRPQRQQSSCSKSCIPMGIGFPQTLQVGLLTCYAAGVWKVMLWRLQGVLRKMWTCLGSRRSITACITCTWTSKSSCRIHTWKIL